MAHVGRRVPAGREKLALSRPAPPSSWAFACAKRPPLRAMSESISPVSVIHVITAPGLPNRKTNRKDPTMNAKHRPAGVLTLAVLISIVITSHAAAQGQPYRQTNLVSDIAGVAERVDSHLVNPWGIVASPNNTIWIADNGTGVSTLYNTRGAKVPPNNPLVVTIPPSASSTEGGNPTGIVFNSTSGFLVNEDNRSGPSLFIFVSEDGVISGWNPQVALDHAVIAVDHGNREAIYKGAAMGLVNGIPRLYVTNFHNAKVEIYNQNFGQINLANKFVDPTIPNGFAPFGIANINGLIYVTYAKQDADAEDDVAGPGFGFVSVFDTQGNFIKRLISRDSLNAPWGLALAPHDFGPFSDALLVGNFGNGRINAYNPNTGALLGHLSKPTGTLVIDGLWGLFFIDNHLFFTAGIADEEHGLFGVIEPGQ
jgi:uncharacterized protein (TIGR03118 family)